MLDDPGVRETKAFAFSCESDRFRKIRSGVVALATDRKKLNAKLHGSHPFALFHSSLHGVLHVLDLCNFNIAQLAIHLFAPADIDSIYDITCLRID